MTKKTSMNGKIGVTTENIFPIIKKFLYSDHEIFLRELVSNAMDATQKLKTLSTSGEFKGELDNLKVKVSVDKDKGTLTVSDSGVGMTAAEIEKYINQIAFSGAEEFLAKYKDQANGIIGHFGLGFYSAFMVADKVEIITKSYQDAPAMHWTCDGSPEYTMEETTRDDRGTDIVLYISDENKEFLEEARVLELLNKYCKFLPVPIVFGKEQEWKDGKYVDTDKDRVINNINPLWTRKPSELKDEDYQQFYRELYPTSEAPLFYIHLNVDYPFTLTGILYFPKIRTNIDFQRNKIQLYSNQVFVTDSVEGIVPDFLTLLHGVIDSPDIPLNVSRSYLQSDSNVKKISSHITKKVSDRLFDIFKNNREDFEKKWDDLKLFMEYGMITDEKFYERAVNFSLFKTTDDKYYTMEEYKALIEGNQKNKQGQLVYLYATDKEAQYTFIESAKEKQYSVLLVDTHLGPHFVNHLETKLQDTRFVRVDSDIIDRLIEKDEERVGKLTPEQQNDMQAVFQANTPEGDEMYIVNFEALSETDAPVIITQNEFMRRMKDMAALGGGGSFNMYGNLPDSYTLVVNTNHPLVLKINEDKEKALADKLRPFDDELKDLNNKQTQLNAQKEGKKEDEIPQVLKDTEKELVETIDAKETERNQLLTNFGKEEKLARQLIDLALLANNKLKGEALNRFVKRSIELLD